MYQERVNWKEEEMKKPAKITMAKFEESRYDVDPKGVKEGSAKDRALDKKQMTKMKAAKRGK